MDYVLHQAAIPSVPRSVKDPVTSNRANIDASLNVLVAARDAGVKRLVYAGSSSAYGNTPTLPKREDMPTAPLSPYALQKLVAEQYCQMFTRLYGLETVTHPLLQRVRPAAGSRLAVLGRHLAVHRPRCSTDASRSIYGDGEQTRDFTYVANVVDGVLRACEAPEAAGEVINVATGGRISLNELLRDDEPDRRDGHRGRSTRRRAPATSATRRPTSPRRGRCSATSRPSALEDGLRQTLEWCQASAIHS